MTRRWRVITTVAGVFVAVIAVVVGIIVFRGRHDVVPTGHPIIMPLTSASAHLKFEPLQVRPLPGVCEEPAIPVGGTPLPCGH